MPRTLSFTVVYVAALFISRSTIAHTTFQKMYGRISFDNLQSLRQTAHGGYILIGATMSFGASATDVYLIKTNANGDTIWTKTYGGTTDDVGTAVEQTTDGFKINKLIKIYFGNVNR